MKIGLVQTSPKFGDKDSNFQEISKLVGNSTADLLVLPELFATGYTFNSPAEASEMAEPVTGPTAQFLQALSLKTGGMIVAGFVEKEGAKNYNSSLIVSQGKVLGTYRKLHLFNKEKLWFEPGNRPLEVFDFKGFKVGVMICFDWLFPEVARTLALRGADVIAHPANLVLPFCQNGMITRCLENRVFAVTANRIGTEARGGDSFTFTGLSQITSYDGKVLASLPKDETGAQFVEADLEKARHKMINSHNDMLKDRRIEFYAQK